MAVIKVPKPPKSAFDKNRKLSTLLEWQIEHFQEAEFRLPVGQTTDIYVNAINTEGEAAEYIRQVTKKIYELHGSPVIKPKKRKRASRAGLMLAASATRARKRKPKVKAKTSRKRKS